MPDYHRAMTSEIGLQNYAAGEKVSANEAGEADRKLLRVEVADALMTMPWAFYVAWALSLVLVAAVAIYLFW
jgi:hypothetical protein